MGMIKILICDDEDVVRMHYKEVIHNHLQHKGLSLHLYASASELLKDRKVIKEAHIILMDICMEQLDGIHAADLLRKINEDIKIIFISSSPDYVFDSFRVHPLNYLLKDQLSDGELIVLLENVIENCMQPKKDEDFICYNNERLVIFRLSDIISFESINRKIIVHTIHGDYASKEQLKDLYDRYCSSGFEYANRSCIVNMKYILKIEGVDVYMYKKFKFAIAYRSKKQFKEKFQTYLLNQND